MGEAKRRGTFEERRAEAISAGRQKRRCSNCAHIGLHHGDDTDQRCHMFKYPPRLVGSRFHCAQHLFKGESWGERLEKRKGPFYITRGMIK